MTPTDIQIMALYVSFAVAILGFATIVWRDGQWKGKVGTQVNFMWEIIQEHFVMRSGTGTSQSSLRLTKKGMAVIADLEGCVQFNDHKGTIQQPRDLLTILQKHATEEVKGVAEKHGLTLAETLATLAVHIESVVQEGKG